MNSLGERVGMSRATLVRRFQEVVGVAPMAYIASWRIMKAHNLIKQRHFIRADRNGHRLFIRTDIEPGIQASVWSLTK